MASMPVCANYENNFYLYVIRCARTRYFKIGVAKNYIKRIEDLQRANPLRLDIAYTFLLPGESNIERILHKKFSEQNIRGEWFDLTDEDISELLRIVESHILTLAGQKTNENEYTYQTTSDKTRAHSEVA